MEHYQSILRILKKNIQAINEVNNSIVIEEDCFQYFSRKINISNKFDIIFLDPPYKEKKLNFILEKIKGEGILNKGGVLIIHRHKKDNQEITTKLNIIDIRNYGVSKIIFTN